MLEPRGLYRTDGQRPDGVTKIPWEMGKQLVWDFTSVDALAPSRLNQASLCNPGPTATGAEARKIEKDRKLIDNGYIFQPVALELQCSLGESSETFITRLCKMLSRSHDQGSQCLFQFQVVNSNFGQFNPNSIFFSIPIPIPILIFSGGQFLVLEPYNKYDKIRPHSIRSLQFDQKVQPLSFRPEKFDLFTATHSCDHEYLNCSCKFC